MRAGRKGRAAHGLHPSPSGSLRPLTVAGRLLVPVLLLPVIGVFFQV